VPEKQPFLDDWVNWLWPGQPWPSVPSVCCDGRFMGRFLKIEKNLRGGSINCLINVIFAKDVG
jgi:hypothetical protein